MKSCVYTGHIRHMRHSPVTNGFRYRLFMLLLDLDELDEVFANHWLWSTGNFNLAWLRRKDHFGDPAITFREAVEKLVIDKTGKSHQGPIRMLTHMRYFGHCFNPATFYYCYDKADSVLEYVIVEVHNTPWGESHCYVLDEEMNRGSKDSKRYQLRKDFHVSPFLPMDIDYTWTFTTPDKELHVRMIDVHKSDRLFEAELSLQRRRLNSATLAGVMVGYPFMTMKVTLGIYWQALKLWLRGAPYFSHP